MKRRKLNLSRVRRSACVAFPIFPRQRFMHKSVFFSAKVCLPRHDVTRAARLMSPPRCIFLSVYLSIRAYVQSIRRLLCRIVYIRRILRSHHLISPGKRATRSNPHFASEFCAQVANTFERAKRISTFSQHRLDNGKGLDFYGNDNKGNITLIWIIGGHLFSRMQWLLPHLPRRSYR